MSTLKKMIVPVAAVYALLAYRANAVLAAGTDFFSNPAGGTSTVNVADQRPLGQAIADIINYLLGLLGLIAVAFLIYAGILMVTAGGNDEQITKARKIITYAVIGIVIIVLAFTIVNFVTNILT